jgi:hypothetical protein
MLTFTGRRSLGIRFEAAEATRMRMRDAEIAFMISG